MKQQPLSGVTVLDFGQVYNGPYCGFLLAQAGARVIKVESIIGETLRARGKTSGSTYPFANLNTNKECITLNIKTPEARDMIRQLVKEVDVLVQNFAPGTLEKFDLGPDDLRAINPRLIYAMSTGYGATEGPYKNYLGMDITLQAISGAMSVTGEENGPPMKTPAAFADFIAGTHLYSGIVTALYAREQSGEGAAGDISMQDCVFPTLSTVIGSYYHEGKPLPRAGSRHPAKSIAPYNVYEAADGHVAIICIREGHWRKFCEAMERPDLKDDDRFVNMQARSQHIDLVDETVNTWTRARSRDEITRICQDNGVICASVQTIPETLEDPHMLARGSLNKVDHPGLGEISLFQTPIRFTDIDPPEIQSVQSLGESTDSILKELTGIGDEELAALKDIDAI
ncbi:MAG: CoA transferase [Gammaproteobacteria bacterium]|nr:CoA transferase [Gammaproteobacteria bacterium]